LPDGAAPAAPQAATKTADNGDTIVQYGRGVQVFPVNGDVSPYTQVNAVHGGYVPGGELVQQVFFAHGSAVVGKGDRKNIHELAQSLVHNKKGDYKIDIVGHASHRVNHIHDPIQKKMINFKMAQKRANAVANELLKAGVSPGWVVASSMGDEQPNPRRNGKSQEAADRRAEVYLSNE
jgi:outer membrane protein OmpA-like peptidoglycan-associated protein